MKGVRIIGLAVAATVIAVVPAVTSAAVQARPTRHPVSITLAFDHAGRVDARSAVGVKFAVAHHPSSGRVLLQRTFGTAGVFRTVKTVRTWAGSFTTKAPPMGRYTYRLLAQTKRNRHWVTLASKSHKLYAYAIVPLGTIVSHSSSTVSVDGSLFRYVIVQDDLFSTSWYRLLKRNATSCSSLTLQAAFLRQTPYDAPPADLQIEQENADPVQVTTKLDGVVQLHASLTGEAFEVRVHFHDAGFSDDADIYVNGSGRCWSSNAAVPK